MRSFRVLLLTIVVLAALLRLGALHAELWFDEIWSWEFACDAASPWQVIAGDHQHHDNNHKLNTLFLWFYPRCAAWYWYRLHSFLAGLATVAVAALTARRRGRAEAVFAALLFAVNYWLVLSSTEARGYALAVCFALLSLFALQEYLAVGAASRAAPTWSGSARRTYSVGAASRAAPTWSGSARRTYGRRMLVLFWLSVMLGFAAHLTFLHCYLALSLWSVYHGARRRLPPRTEVRQLLAIHLVPCLFVAGLYVVDIRRMQLGGAPPMPASLVLGRLLSLGLGVSPSVVGTVAAVVGAAVALGFGLRLLARDDQHVWLFFAVVILGSPALFLLAKPAYLFERYFLISFVFFLLLLSYVLGALWRGSRSAAVAAVVLALGMSGGGMAHIAAFERGGRGHFFDALAYIDRQSPPGEVSICGDYDFRVRKFFRFYAPYLGAGARFMYREQETLPAQGTNWLLVHRLDDRHPPELRMYDANDNAYEQVQDFPAATFGGWNWYVYRNMQALPPARSASKGIPQPAAPARASLAGAAG